MHRRLFALLALVALLAMPAVPVAAAPTDPASVVQQFVDAVNRQDMNAAGALLTDNVVALGGPCTPQACIGKAAVVRSLEIPPGGSLNVRIQGMPMVEGNIVMTRLEIRFAPVAPELTAAGIERTIEMDRMLIEDGKIAAWSGVQDVTDAQTQASVRLEESMPHDHGPAGPGGMPGMMMPMARDGQILSMQSIPTRVDYIMTYGPDADQRWVDDHNAALARQGR